MVKVPVRRRALLRDEFTGSGALTAHSPDVVPADASWSIANGTFGELTGGSLPYTSGDHGVALINPSVTDFDLIATVAAVAGSDNAGVCLRSAADGSTRYLLSVDTVNGRLNFGCYTALATYSTTVDHRTGTYWPTVGAGEHTLRIIAKDGEFRYGLAGKIYARVLDDGYSGGYLGPGVRSAALGLAWNSLTVNLLPTFRQFTFIGASNTTDLAYRHDDGHPYPNFSLLTAMNYKDGYTETANWAVAGTGVLGGGSNMTGQVDQCRYDNPSAIFVDMGGNDADDAAVQTTYRSLLGTLNGHHPGVPIYCFLIIPNADAERMANRAANNPRIAAAVADAAGAGIPAVLMDTTSPSDWVTVDDLWDGSHVTNEGAWKMADKVLGLIA